MRQGAAWIAFVAAGGVLAAAATAVPTPWGALLVYVGVMIASSATVFVVLRRDATPWGDPWWLVDGGLALLAVHLLITVGLDARWWSGVAVHLAGGVLQLAGYALVVTASARFIRLRTGGGDWDGVIDGSIVGCATAVVVWQWAAPPVQDGRLTELVVGAVPAVLLAVVLALAVRMLLVASQVPAARLLAASSIASFVGNVVILDPGLHGGLSLFALGCWITCQALLLGAAVHPSRPQLVSRTPGEATLLVSRLVMLALALVAVPVSTALHSTQGRLVPVAGSTMITTLALWRIGRLLHDRERRARHQAAMLDLGRLAVSGDLGALYDGAAAAVRHALRTELVAVIDTSEGAVAVRAAGQAWPRTLDDAEQGELLRAFAARGTADDGATEAGLGPARLWLMPFGPSSQPHGFVAATSTRSRSDLVTLDGVAQILGAGVRRLDAEAQLLHSSLHDALTGLPNRVLLHDRLRGVIRRARASGTPFAVMFVDLDGFKQVNDTFGHSAGDDVLVLVADRLRRSVRPEDTVARVSGDEFVVVVEQVEEPVTAAAAERVVRALAEPVAVSAGVTTLTASVGALLVRVRPDDDVDSDRVLRRADELMYRVKRAGKNSFALASMSLRDAGGGSALRPG